MNDPIAALYAEHLAELRRRHDAALERAGCSHVVVYSGGLHFQFLDDRDYPFAANPHFKAWVPLPASPECFVAYRPGERPTLLFHQPVDYWHGTPEDPEGFWTGHYDIHVVGNEEEAGEWLRRLGGDGAFIGEWDERFAHFGLGSANPPGLLAELHYRRAWKTGYEVECMRRASAVAVGAHRAAERAFREGASELDIHLAYCRAARTTEAELPYNNIVALNENGAVLHYTDYRREAPAQRRSFLIDAGAACGGYAADITRSYAAQAGEFADLIALTDAAQQRICERVRPGVRFVELNEYAHETIADVLVEAGIWRASAAAAIDSGATRCFLPHGLGHLLGLQVHDIGGHQVDADGREQAPPEAHPFLRLTRTLEPGFVCTIEPGIYFIDVLLDELRESPVAGDVSWDAVERLKPYGGIRIEDDVHVVTDGAENLTRDAFSALS